ncbi:MAG TPA: bifunctional glutamate N-acetyltransferase/amino-acid acetyltransferase ArgJ [Nonomuraea sp.]|nr:bifunctional glutamate N-acetyltransferase/amino-acid acetyltransferase ArgJ [Nonomuraea sp.]
MTQPSRVAQPGLVAIEERAVLPRGFLAAGGRAGIKESGRPDLALLTVSGAEPAAAAATFTTNRVLAAPVRLSRAHLAASAGRARAVVVTSGCANAATGPAGDEDQRAVVAAVAERLDATVEQVLCASTGLIGTRLPVERIRDALASLAPDGLRADDDGWTAFGEAIMTTDSRPKSASARISLPGPDGTVREVVVSGVCKGVGMIHPRMATMIAVLATDAAATPTTLAGLLGPAVRDTFGQLTVDGDTSTNDSVFLLASGAAGTRDVEPGTPAAEALGGAIRAVCRSLARQQAADGEGATTLVTCRVEGAADLDDARAVARAVVASSLVKAAVHGRDPNWGRVAAAAGAARREDGRPVELEPDRLRIGLCGTTVFEAAPVDFDRDAVSAAMAADEVVIELALGIGAAAAEAFGCDLSEEYVRENSAYST